MTTDVLVGLAQGAHFFQNKKVFSSFGYHFSQAGNFRKEADSLKKWDFVRLIWSLGQLEQINFTNYAVILDYLTDTKSKYHLEKLNLQDTISILTSFRDFCGQSDYDDRLIDALILKALSYDLRPRHLQSLLKTVKDSRYYNPEVIEPLFEVTL